MSSEGNGDGARNGNGPGNGSGSGNGSASPVPRRRARKAALLAAVFTVGAIGGGAVVTATDAWSHWGRWGGMKGHHGDPAAWTEHMQGHALFWLDRVDATDEQREAVSAILGETGGELAGALGEHRALRREWLTELERPDLDAGALEALRARHVALMDEKSRKALDIVVRVGAVLTAEQRGELVSMLSRHRRGHGHRRGDREEG